MPNHGAFDVAGRLLSLQFGDYWNPTGTGWIAHIDAAGITSRFHDGPFRFANGWPSIPRANGCMSQSTAANIVRIPLAAANGPIETVYELPAGTIPDGIVFTASGDLLIACYKPDAVLLGRRDGKVEVVCDDPTGELLCRPTNIALRGGELFIANLGGWHITVLDTSLESLPLNYPMLDL